VRKIIADKDLPVRPRRLVDYFLLPDRHVSSHFTIVIAGALAAPLTFC
jgi:hypothetical protein